jgi:hypothetical protein
MNDMFEHAVSFNQPLNTWDTHRVQSMTKMFYEATVFNQHLSCWDCSNLKDMAGALCGATSFKGRIPDEWTFAYLDERSTPIDDGCYPSQFEANGELGDY